jgi:hypothetical protein
MLGNNSLSPTSTSPHLLLGSCRLWVLKLFQTSMNRAARNSRGLRYR